MYVSAQISLYPLRQKRLSPAIEQAWAILEKNGLGLEKGGMSTVVTGEAARVFRAVEEVFLATAEQGPVALVVTFSNACPT
ncbi:MAG: thiamine-binding protein [Deltaproteobacteria bacterium]|nr:thiamine-binding protein [Deltaproteobacteria bacterium]MBW2122510.1 thiamine-binding protein [Deltaproteobacteria bacterium]